MPTATVERKPGIPPLQRACLFLGMAFYWSCSSISRNDYVIFRRTSSSSDVYTTLFVFLMAMLTLGIAFYALRRPLENALVHRRWFVGALSPLASLALVPMLYTDPGSTDAYWPLRAASCFVLVGWYLVVTFAWCLSAVALGVREGVLTAVLTYVAAALNLAYGPVQFRFSEALTVLPVFTPAAVPGLALGCFLANLGSPLGIVDWVFGTGATLLAAIGTWLVGRVRVRDVPVLAPLPPVIANVVLVGFELSCLSSAGTFAFGNFTWAAYGASALSVGIGELVVCYALGIPLLMLLKRAGAGTKLFQ